MHIHAHAHGVDMAWTWTRHGHWVWRGMAKTRQDKPGRREGVVTHKQVCMQHAACSKQQACMRAWRRFAPPCLGRYGLLPRWVRYGTVRHASGQAGRRGRQRRDWTPRLLACLLACLLAFVGRVGLLPCPARWTLHCAALRAGSLLAEDMYLPTYERTDNHACGLWRYSRRALGRELNDKASVFHFSFFRRVRSAFLFLFFYFFVFAFFLARACGHVLLCMAVCSALHGGGGRSRLSARA